MIDEDNIIGNKEVAEILGYKDNALSMVKLRSKDFPKPIKILSATPLYRKTDIKEWAKKHGREKLKLIESTDNYIMITLGGERGAGKSFLTSLFVRRSIEYRKASCGMGDHCTQCVVKNSIRANLEDSEEMVILRVLPEKVKNIERRKELEEKIAKQDFEHEDVLGDIIISIEKVKEQAIEYGHSFERELSYMLVHGFYHLMGYDHIEEEDKKEMRPKEEKILNELKITRD